VKSVGEARAGIKSLSLWTFSCDFLALKGLTRLEKPENYFLILPVSFSVEKKKCR